MVSLTIHKITTAAPLLMCARYCYNCLCTLETPSGYLSLYHYHGTTNTHTVSSHYSKELTSRRSGENS